MTDARSRDRVADTPHHKFIRARVRAAAPDAVVNAVVRTAEG